MEDKKDLLLINKYMDDVNHEVRTMIGSILGLSAIGESDVSDHEKTMECFEGIKSTSKELLKFIDETILSSKLQLGLDVGGDDCFTLKNLKEMVDEYAKRKRLSNTKVNVTLEGDESLILTGNLHRVRYVISHLVDDSINRLSQKVEFKIVLDSMGETDYRIIQVTYSDDGYMLEANNEEPDAEYMLTRDILTKMNGEIKKVNAVNGNNVILLTFGVKPYDNSAKKNVNISGNDELKISDEFAGKRILLVEDNEINANVTKDVIEFTGAAVEWAINGADAIKLISESEENYYDMILMDLQMPEMDGYEATAAIRKLSREDVKKIPILALTADVLLSSIKKATDIGMDNYIVKPIELENIVSIMRKYL